MNYRYFIILILLAAIVKLLTSNDDIKRNEVLIVGTNGEFPPFTFIEKGQIVGFDIDVVEEVALRMNKKIKWKDMPFDSLIPELALGQIQLVAAGMSHTEERAQRVLFTKSYLAEDPLVIVVYSHDEKMKKITLDELKGKTIIVNEGYTSDLFLSSKPELNLVRLNAPADAFLALKSHRGDAFVTSKSTFDFFVDNQKDDHFSSTEIPETGEGCSLVISKKHPQLLETVQKVLDEMGEDGTLKKLKKKWKLS